MGRTWSIERRLFRWVAGSATLMSLVYGVAAVWIVGSSLHRELDELAIEEIEELEAQARGRVLDDAELERLMDEIAGDHPDYRFSWRVWELTKSDHRLAFGATPALEIPTAWDAARAIEHAPDRGVRWLTSELRSGLGAGPDSRKFRVGMLIDAAPRRASARRALGLLLGALALTALTTAAGGLWLSRRVGRTLKGAADAARALDDPNTPPSIAGDNAPVEISAVAAAFSDSLEALRRQHSTKPPPDRGHGPRAALPTPEHDGRDLGRTPARPNARRVSGRSSRASSTRCTTSGVPSTTSSR